MSCTKCAAGSHATGTFFSAKTFCVVPGRYRGITYTELLPNSAASSPVIQLTVHGNFTCHSTKGRNFSSLKMETGGRNVPRVSCLYKCRSFYEFMVIFPEEFSPLDVSIFQYNYAGYTGCLKRR